MCVVRPQTWAGTKLDPRHTQSDKIHTRGTVGQTIHIHSQIAGSQIRETQPARRRMQVPVRQATGRVRSEICGAQAGQLHTQSPDSGACTQSDYREGHMVSKTHFRAARAPSPTRMRREACTQTIIHTQTQPAGG